MMFTPCTFVWPGDFKPIDSNIFVQEHLLVILSASEESRCPTREILRWRSE